MAGHQITVLARNPAALEGYQVDIVKGMKTSQYLQVTPTNQLR